MAIFSDLREFKVQLFDHRLVLNRCRYFQQKQTFLNSTKSNENLWQVEIPVDNMSLSDTAVLLQFCSLDEFDVFELSRYSLDFLLQFSDFFDCDYILMEYFHYFISRDLLLTIKEFF